MYPYFSQDSFIASIFLLRCPVWETIRAKWYGVDMLIKETITNQWWMCHWPRHYESNLFQDCLIRVRKYQLSSTKSAD